ncbi:MAG: leucine-rich repeat domain-containing protein, partial [Bacteroidales bacterium]|nr:leucine-rich repeat domain-containing protein [Bacteroidales bacterium]
MRTYFDAVKKALAVLACACLTLALLPAAALAQAGDELATFATDDVVDSGTCGDDLTWTLIGTEEEGYTLTISGTGDMWDYEGSYAVGAASSATSYAQSAVISSAQQGNAPWYDYGKDIALVEIDFGVTSIGERAFVKCSAFTEISIPDGITSIGDEGFLSCNSLEYVNIGGGLEYIGDAAFWGDGSLLSFDVSSENSSFASVDGVLFDKGQTELVRYPSSKDGSTYTVPEGTTTIRSTAFDESTLLEYVEIPASVTVIGSSAFYDCQQLKSIDIPSGVTELEYTFYNCSLLSDVSIGGGVEQIGESTFYYCSSLESLDLSKSVRTIGIRAFWGCSSLQSLSLGVCLESVGRSAFAYCNALSDIYYTGTEAQWEAIDLASSAGLSKATIHYNWVIETPDPGDGNPDAGNPEGSNPDPK